jgi:FtsP/CotA-like multicopper oxidase with cupredoxin domain
MNRRELLKYAGYGLAAIVVGDLELPPMFSSKAHAASMSFDLTIGEAMVEMVDLTAVYMKVFGTPALGPSFPGPVIVATEGDDITINVSNTLGQRHAFQIVGTRIGSGPIDPGQTKTVSFKAPAAGTYMYVDPTNAPVNRVLGLHGAIVVLPPPGRGNKTPYSAPSANVQKLFNTLGRTTDFPGEAWNPDPAADRSRIWLIHSIDPNFNALAEQGLAIDRHLFMSQFMPRYFTINGKSGAFASHDPSITMHGRIGQPHLIRLLNAGMATHSPHFHANHIYVLSENNVVQKNVFHLDTFTMRPLDRVDVLLPFIRPPDIPGNPATPLRELLSNELAMVVGTPLSPLAWPMHCHMEMSQTAAGGNYPQGLVTHWEITGDVDGVDFPVPAV